MNSIQTIIYRLGYNNSDKLFYSSDIDACSELSWHDRRVLKVLSPYAVYVVDGSVLAVFFDDLHIKRDIELQGKIWNAQIPVVISDEGNLVKIYNGKSMNLGQDKIICLKNIAEFAVELCDESNVFSYWNITNSMSLELYEKSLSKKSLNDFLVENLSFITKELKEKYKVSFANRLVLRIIFIRYLIDRGISIGYKGLNENVEKSRECFLNIVQNKKDILALFGYLKNKFNGNLFEIDEQKEEDEISSEVLNMLYNFLTAQIEMKTGQMCLFPFYDFNIIPIELISNIYEILLGKKKQNKDKAFYTPEYLVDYIVRNTVSNNLINEKECKILDPSCGSGIFLVKAFQKILERNADSKGFIRNKNLINNLLKQNIFGVDYNEEAVDVTIFSLYVTLFDYQDPKDLEMFKLPLLKGKNIIFGDFFDDEKIDSIRDISFKFIIGNPPWGRVKQKRYKEYCANRGIIPQDGEICVAFLLKAQEIGNEDTECSLVIPSKILYKGKQPSVDFRKGLISSVMIRQVLEISAVRKQIFKGAIAPAAVISFICKKSDLFHKVEYISLKPNRYLRLLGIIMIEPNDIKYVEQVLLKDYDQLWKTLVYGSYWDFELLCKMRQNMKSIKAMEDEKGLIHGKGIQDHLGDAKDATHLLGRDILDSDEGVEHFEINLNNLTVFDKDKIHRPRKQELFDPPYVLFKKGLDCTDYSIKAVYTEERLVYKETINCIKGTKETENTLLNLTGLFNSSLFAYFSLMLGSSAGIEREQIFLDELEEFPYCYSEKLVELVKVMQRKVSERDDTGDILKQIDKCVLDMYGVEDNVFVNYALNIQIPMLCGKYIEKPCDLVMLQNYAETFSGVWDKHFAKSKVYYSINLYPQIKGKFVAFQMKFSFDKQESSIKVIEDVDDDIELLTMFMIYQINDCFYQTKNIVQFAEDSFVIVKAMDEKNWHSAMAVKDSYKVLNDVLLGEEESI